MMGQRPCERMRATAAGPVSTGTGLARRELAIHPPSDPMGLTGLEPVTLRLSSARSNQLSYKPAREMMLATSRRRDNGRTRFPVAQMPPDGGVRIEPKHNPISDRIAGTPGKSGNPPNRWGLRGVTKRAMVGWRLALFGRGVGDFCAMNGHGRGHRPVVASDDREGRTVSRWCIDGWSGHGPAASRQYPLPRRGPDRRT